MHDLTVRGVALAKTCNKYFIPFLGTIVGKDNFFKFTIYEPSISYRPYLGILLLVR